MFFFIVSINLHKNYEINDFFYKIKWTNTSESIKRESFNNIYIAIDVINKFYIQNPKIKKRAIWKLFKKNLNDFQFIINDNFDNNLKNDVGIYIRREFEVFIN